MSIRNVLSLFDGISCGRLALNKAKIKYNKYYASEIDKYAIAITKYNFPDTIFVGDIRKLKGKDFKNIDLIIGGSPCTNFSFSGKKQGIITKNKIEVISLEQYLELKEQGFEFKGQSYLFWEFVRLLKEIKPKYFLLENVRMAKKWKNVITNTLKVEPIEINSALVSAQNRPRLYWTNIPIKGLPKDKGLKVKDILISNYKGNYLTNDYIKEMLTINYKQTNRITDINKKAYCLHANGGGRTGKASNIIFDGKGYRRTTPLENERLQTLPDNYTEYGLFDDGKVKKISDTQRYKCIGNGWTVDVIAWIFSFIK